MSATSMVRMRPNSIRMHEQVLRGRSTVEWGRKRMWLPSRLSDIKFGHVRSSSAPKTNGDATIYCERRQNFTFCPFIFRLTPSFRMGFQFQNGCLICMPLSGDTLLLCRGFSNVINSVGECDCIERIQPTGGIHCGALFHQCLNPEPSGHTLRARTHSHNWRQKCSFAFSAVGQICAADFSVVSVLGAVIYNQSCCCYCCCSLIRSAWAWP